MRFISVTTAAMLCAIAGQAMGQIQHGYIEVIENDGGNNEGSVDEARVGGFGDWIVLGGNRGDIDVDFPGDADALNGILITGVAQLERSEPSLPGPYYCTSFTARNGDDNYFIPVSPAPDGGEANMNVSIAYFSLADGWTAGAAYNAENGGNITDLVAQAGIELRNTFDFTGEGAEFIDMANGQFIFHNNLAVEGGHSIDMVRDGIVLAVGAKNEDNYCAVAVNPLNGDFGTPVGLNRLQTVWLLNKDNGDDGGGNEQDPVAFVFIPAGTPDVVMGRFTNSSRKLFEQGDWSVERTDVGTFELTIAGESADTGTLVVSPASIDNLNIDNVVSMEPTGNTWTITTRDIPGMGLQDLNAEEVVCHFAFFPNDIAVSGPGNPPQDYAEFLDVTAGAGFEVTEYTPDNGQGDMGVTDIDGIGLDVAGDNRGDVYLSWYDARLVDQDGILISTITEFLRDNTDTGGVSGFGTTSVDNGIVRTFGAGKIGGEMNVNFDAVLFPVAAGFALGTDIGAQNGMVTIDAMGADPVNDGVLIAINWDNNNRIVTVDPTEGAWDLTVYEATSTDTFDAGDIATDSVEVGVVALPYDTEGLIAGQVDVDGSTISGTGGFTAGTGVDGDLGIPVVTIQLDEDVPGRVIVSPRSAASAIALSVEREEGGLYEVAGFDLAAGSFAAPPAFSFAFIPDTGIQASAGCFADCDGNGQLNILDFVCFQQLFQAGADGADCDANGQLNILDFVCFQQAFQAGCN